MFNRLAIIALLGVSLCSAKSFPFNLADISQAGSVKLKPGEYAVKVDGDKVTLVDHSGHAIETNAKLETADHKFAYTEVAISSAGGTNRIESITLAGSKNKVVFQ